MPFLFALLKAASPLSSREGLICSKPEGNVGRAHAIGRKLLRARKATRITKREDNLQCILVCMVAGYWSFDCFLGEMNILCTIGRSLYLDHAGCYYAPRGFQGWQPPAPITAPKWFSMRIEVWYCIWLWCLSITGAKYSKASQMYALQGTPPQRYDWQWFLQRIQKNELQFCILIHFTSHYI